MAGCTAVSSSHLTSGREQAAFHSALHIVITRFTLTWPSVQLARVSDFIFVKALIFCNVIWNAVEIQFCYTERLPVSCNSMETHANIKSKGYECHWLRVCQQAAWFQKGLEAADVLSMPALWRLYSGAWASCGWHGDSAPEAAILNSCFVVAKHSEIYFLHQAFFLPITSQNNIYWTSLK